MPLKKTPPKKFPSRALLVSLGIPAVFFPGLVLASLLGWNWQDALTKVAAQGGYKQSEEIFPKSAVITKVFDGDTVQLDNGQSLRLTGVSAPDRGQPSYELATEYLRDLIEGEKVEIEYDTYQEDQFGRLLGYVWERCTNTLGCKDGKRMINWVMIKKKLAIYLNYQDRRKLKYDGFLQSAESN